MLSFWTRKSQTWSRSANHLTSTSCTIMNKTYTSPVNVTEKCQMTGSVLVWSAITWLKLKSAGMNEYPVIISLLLLLCHAWFKEKTIIIVFSYIMCRSNIRFILHELFFRTRIKNKLFNLMCSDITRTFCQDCNALNKVHMVKNNPDT